MLKKLQLIVRVSILGSYIQARKKCFITTFRLRWIYVIFMASWSSRQTCGINVVQIVKTYRYRDRNAIFRPPTHGRKQESAEINLCRSNFRWKCQETSNGQMTITTSTLRSNSFLGRPKMYPIYIENVVTVLYIIKTLHIYKALSTCMYCINSFLE